MATYVNDLRLKEIATGDESGTWGTSTNTNLSLIADAFSLGTKQMAADADETFTMPDATADGVRSLYLKITSAVSLTATRTVTLAPNTVSKVWIIENATTGSQIITIKQGSGATVNVPNGSKLMIVTDGAGATAAVFNANPTTTSGTVTSVGGTGTVNGITLTGTVTSSGNLTLGGTLSNVSLTTQVTGILPTANGGTANAFFTVSGPASSAKTFTFPNASATVLTTNAAVTVAQGGTGATTLTGVVKGNGTSAFTAGTVALGSEVSGTLPVANGGTGITSFGTGVATWLGTPSSANLAAAVTDETGSGALVFATSPTLVTPALGTPSSATLTNATGLPIVNGTTGTLSVARGGTGQTSYVNGELLIGNTTGNTLTKATLTAGSGVSITNGAGSITIAATGAALSGVTESVSPFETALGSGAGVVNTGVNNTFLGFEAGNDNTTGTDNTAVGYQALDANTIGQYNVAMGSGALGANTTGNSNTAMGMNALLANTTGLSNTALGMSSLRQNTTGINNTAVGRLTLDVNTTGQDNTALGTSSLRQNTTGSSNTAVGLNALFANTGGTFNVAVGKGSLVANTTGEYNTAVGPDALYNNTTASFNVGVGYNALYNNTTGSGLLAVGTGALRANTTGANNTAVGSGTLDANTIGTNNVATGYRALYVNTTGTDNTAVGYQALDANTTGSNNTAMGASALGANTTGANNTAVGYQSGDQITTGTQNVTLGTGAASSGTNDLTTGSNNIIIGYNAAASSATVSNEVTLGNDSITSTRLRGMVELNASMFEKATISATAATGTINFDARTQSVLYYTSNASANWTVNIRAASGVSLDSVMTTGESMTVAFLVTQGATAYYNSAVQVDGSSVTPKWQGGTAPTAGNASSIDAYIYTIIKTGSATFTVLASQTRFA